MKDVEANVGKLRAIHDLGVKIAIDDFGTGYSSLSYLARLPVQVLKIDVSFIARMCRRRSIVTLVATMISLAHSLGLTVVAEGVETEEQAAALQAARLRRAAGLSHRQARDLRAARRDAATHPSPSSIERVAELRTHALERVVGARELRWTPHFQRHV